MKINSEKNLELMEKWMSYCFIAFMSTLIIIAIWGSYMFLTWLKGRTTLPDCDIYVNSQVV